MTTALTKFQRLEAQGSWRASPLLQPRDVVVSVGDATLILFDPKTDSPLSHWSLAAVIRLNPTTLPAVYAPGGAGNDETVSIDDALMIDAIARVQGAVAIRRAQTGRLKSAGVAMVIVALLGGLTFWLPAALVGHAARIAPPAQARNLGMAALADLERESGAVCRRESGQAVLDWLAPRLLDVEAVIRVVPGPLGGARRLPGSVYVIGSDLLRNEPGPEAAAAHLISASLAVDDETLRLAAMRHAGPFASLRLMTLGHLPDGAMYDFGGETLLQPAPRAPDTELLAALAKHNISAESYARTIDPTGQSVQRLLMGSSIQTPPLLSDEQWLALQQICAG